MGDGVPAAVAHAVWALENGATLQQAASASGLSEQFVGSSSAPSGPDGRVVGERDRDMAAPSVDAIMSGVAVIVAILQGLLYRR